MDGGRISRGWHLSKLSWNVIQHDRTLLVLPVLQCVATLGATAALFIPAAYYGVADDSNIPFVVAAILWTYPLTFVSTFFGVAFMAVARKKLSGEPATLRDGFAAARSRLRQIAAWALVATLVGAVIQGLERLRGGFIAARIVGWLLGAAWALGTFFVVPILALEGLGPIEAAKRSVHVIQKRWGEGVVGVVTIGAAFALLEIPIVILGMIGFLSFHDSHEFGIVVLALAAVLFLVVSAAEWAVNQLFHLELFAFATTGAPVGNFDEEALSEAFRHKGRVRGSDDAKSIGTLDAPTFVDRVLRRSGDDGELEQTRTQLVDELHRVGLVDRSGLRVRPVRMFVDDDGHVGVVLDDRYGERWSGPAAEALARLRTVPTGAGEAGFWPALRG